MLCWQVSAAMHMSPLTAAEAVSAALITGARWRLDAMHYIRHFPDAQQPSIRYNISLDDSAWSAAYSKGTAGDFLASAQARAEADVQLHNGVHARSNMSINGKESFHPWHCYIRHLDDTSKPKLSEPPHPMHVGDYIAEMQMEYSKQ